MTTRLVFLPQLAFCREVASHRILWLDTTPPVLQCFSENRTSRSKVLRSPGNEYAALKIGDEFRIRADIHLYECDHTIERHISNIA
ncbi:hypothetical protein [Glutamicibacter nicotianae]|uniref:hypothetical protein n=1 Tax=Glutamicibacter nicotianae TaxID=37929 RepID=UPI000EF88270|nr:hypothetical protein [Glutamicibacter nicotianae]